MVTDGNVLIGTSIIDSDSEDKNFGPFKDYATSELGYTGTPIYNGFIDTEEWVGGLKGIQLYKTIDQMRTDAIIGAIERGYFLPIEQGELTFSYDDAKVEKDPFYLNQIDFIRKDFGNINKTVFLHNANLAFPYGFSLFEQCYEFRKDNYYHLSKLSPRLPKTVWKWRVDPHGNLLSVIQLVYVYGDDKGIGKGIGWQFKKIPADKILLITHQKEGGNFAGRSEYRSFYREWKVKDAAMKQSVITVQRVGGGIPYAILDPDKSVKDSEGNKGTLSQVQEVLKQMQAGESSYAVFEGVKEFNMLKLDPGAMEALINKTSAYCDESMYKSAFQMVMSLGTSSTGSRALGETFEGLYYVGLEGKAQTICAAIDEQVIKRLIDINFGKQEHYPKVHIKLKQDIGAVTKLLGEFKKYGLMRGNKELENKVLAEVDMPATTPENEMEMAPATPLEQTSNDQNVNMSHSKGCQCGKHHNETIEMADIKVRRNPKKHEVGMDFEKNADELNTIKKSLAMELRHICEPAMIAMGKELAEGKKVYETKVQWGNRVSDLYRKYYKRMMEKGSRDVKNELAKQDIKLSETLHLAAAFRAEPTERLKEWDKYLNEQSGIESYMLENDASTAVAQYYATGRAQGLSGEELTRFVTDMVMAEKGARYAGAATDILEAYGMVREISADEFNEIITSKVRSEIFDNHICEVCQDQDGMVYTKGEDGEFYGDAGEPAPDAPFQDCIGAQYGNPCRGIYLYSVD